MEDRRAVRTNINQIMKSARLSKEIEEGIYDYAQQYCHNENMDENMIPAIYQTKLNDIIANLDRKSSIGNSYLKKMVQSEEIPAHNVAFMTPQELFPEHWEQIQRKIEFCEYKTKNMAASDSFPCRKCGAKRSHVTQMQTRSADEPMTTFVTCLECGHRFRF